MVPLNLHEAIESGEVATGHDGPFDGTWRGRERRGIHFHLLREGTRWLDHHFMDEVQSFQSFMTSLTMRLVAVASHRAGVSRSRAMVCLAFSGSEVHIGRFVPHRIEQCLLVGDRGKTG